MKNKIKYIYHQYCALFCNKKPTNIIKYPEILENWDESNNFVLKDFFVWHVKKNTQILKNINLNIKKNKITALIGPSGCGKSTLLHYLNQTNEIENFRCSGNIFLDGKSVFDKDMILEQLRIKVGMVFQKPILFPFSIKKNITFAAESLGMKCPNTLNKLVYDSLISVGLWNEVKNDLNSLGETLSGGQQQRLALARTISLKPKILLMDEPTSALDPISSAKIEELIINLSKQYTIILVSHSMSQVRRISDYTVFMQKGEIIEYNTTREIFTKPKKKITANYINSEY